MRFLYSIMVFQLIACSSATQNKVVERYKKQAALVTIIKDKWGVPHIYGKTDADAVFGLMYAQCEENFEKVEMAYLQRLGRMSEAEGKEWLQEDLKARLLFDTTAALADYQKSPAWLKELMQAFADGINYYLYEHPETKPAVITHFEPWYALLHTDGAYISTQTAGLLPEQFQALYAYEGVKPTSLVKTAAHKEELTGSNGFAIAPSRSQSGNALLYINPHVSFYFRMEAHMISEEGLNAYGAVTWGQFFVFQGFNESCGWMHTSTAVDASDLYEEKVHKKGSSYVYEYDKGERPVTAKKIVVSYKEEEQLKPRTFTAYYTHHGPVLGRTGEKWLSLKAHNRSLNGLIQSWQRTKAKNFASFKKVMQLRSNASTNTMYADNKGNIAYWHGNLIPKRNPSLNPDSPLDGSLVETEWLGVHELDEIVNFHNPDKGWIQNCNSSPFTATGDKMLNPDFYPAYMAPEGENFRSLQAIRELERERLFTMDKLIALGYNHYLSAFDSMLPPLLTAYENLPAADSSYSRLLEPISLLQAWDKRSGINSIATTLAILWGYTVLSSEHSRIGNQDTGDQVAYLTNAVRYVPEKERLKGLETVMNQLEKLFGTWKVPWGEINRYQRLSNQKGAKYDDAGKSWPVGLASALFGSLAAYESDWFETKKAYGYAGNSFVAVVEFGNKVRAKCIHTGGQSFSSGSKHFIDQAAMFIEGRFRDVLFYREDVDKQIERSYNPGNE